MKDLSYLKNWGIVVNHCWNYGPLKLLLHFIEYPLDQLNSKHMKIPVNSTIQFLEGRHQNKCLLKVFLVHSPQNDGPVKFVKLDGNQILIVIIFKLQEYQTFVLMKLHNVSKVEFANNKFSFLFMFILTRLLSPCLIFCMIFEEKCFSGFILTSDEISLPGCFYFARYWAIFVLQLLTGFWRHKFWNLPDHSNQVGFFTWPKSQDKKLNILRTIEVFKYKNHFSSLFMDF